MILDVVVGALISLVQTILVAAGSLFPTVSAPTAAGFAYGYTFLDSIVPLHEVLGLAVTSIQVVGVILGLRVIVWALRKIPFVGIH